MGVNMMDGARREEVLRTARDSVDRYLAYTGEPSVTSAQGAVPAKVPVAALVKASVKNQVKAATTKKIGASGPVFGAA
jgi:hypothetical protein